MATFLSMIFGLLGVSGITFYGIYCRTKDNLIKDIHNLLEDCRTLSSWDDIRSELKLMSWIEGDERALHWKTLRELHSIRNSMIKYWQIHLEMQEKEKYGEFQTEPQSFKKFIFSEMLSLRRKKYN